MKKNAINIFALLMFLILANNVLAATYYVSPSGDDVTGDGSIGTPWLTIQGAIDQATVVNGDIIIVQDGTYNENVNVTKELTIQSANGYTSTMVVAVNTFDHVFAVTSNNVTIEGFTAYGATATPGTHLIGAIYLGGVDNCTIFKNRCGYDATHYNAKGIMVDASVNNLISNNISNYNSNVGVQFYGSHNNTTLDNVFSNNNMGIVNQGTNNNFRGNLIEDNGSYGVYNSMGGTADFGSNNLLDKGRNTFKNNGGYDVYNNTSNTINGYYNYWGTTDGPTIDSHIHDNEEGGGEVFFTPWLTADESLPVELSSFTIKATNQGVICKWTTESEIENLGFILERKIEGTEWHEIASYKTDNNLMGQGTTPSFTNYEYLDILVEPNTAYEYRLADVDQNGVVTYHSTRKVTVEYAPLTSVVEEFTVLPAYPNPFNPSTTIRYGIPNNVIASGATQSHTNITIYDITGKLINTLFNGEQTPGWHSVVWNGTNQHSEQAPAGLYFSRITSGNEVKTTKLMLLK